MAKYYENTREVCYKRQSNRYQSCSDNVNQKQRNARYNNLEDILMLSLLPRL